jgi:hypothetical protein
MHETLQLFLKFVREGTKQMNTIKAFFKRNIFISMILKTYFDSFQSDLCDIIED